MTLTALPTPATIAPAPSNHLEYNAAADDYSIIDFADFIGHVTTVILNGREAVGVLRSVAYDADRAKWTFSFDGTTLTTTQHHDHNIRIFR